MGDKLQKCSDRLPCIRLHNGGVLQYEKGRTFAGTDTTNAIFFNLDPDGNGLQGRANFYLYSNGRITTGETKLPDTVITNGVMTSQDVDPAYLSNWN